MAERDERFLSRWSRLKQRGGDTDEAAREAAAPPAESPDGAPAVQEDAEADANRVAAEAIDLDAMKYGDDFSVFIRRGVPEPLRRRALRKFFASDPLLAVLDGLNDYDEDFNNPEYMVYRSTWDAARGFLTDAEKAAQQATGGLSSLLDGSRDEADRADRDDAGARDAVAETDGTADAEGPVPAGPEGGTGAVLPEAATDAEPIVAEGADEVPETEPEPEPEPAPRRVSIRRRLEG